MNRSGWPRVISASSSLHSRAITLRHLGVWELVLEEAGVDRQAVHVDAHLVHLGDAVLGEMRELRDVQLADVGPEPVPLPSALRWRRGTAWA